MSDALCCGCVAAGTVATAGATDRIKLVCYSNDLIFIYSFHTSLSCCFYRTSVDHISLSLTRMCNIHAYTYAYSHRLALLEAVQQDFDTCELIWNAETRAELHLTLTTELEQLDRVKRERHRTVWNDDEFAVQHPSLAGHLRVGKYYVGRIAQAGVDVRLLCFASFDLFVCLFVCMVLRMLVVLSSLPVFLNCLSPLT